MSSITAWLSGTSAAPNTPCSRRKATICSMRLRDPAQHRGDGEAGGADDEQLLAAEARRHPAERRGHDRGGDDVGGQHPVDLILGRRQRSLHVGQRDVGDRRVERLHDRRHHDADGDHAPDERRDRLARRAGHGAPAALALATGRTRSSIAPADAVDDRAQACACGRCRSTTSALMPARRSEVS